MPVTNDASIYSAWYVDDVLVSEGTYAPGENVPDLSITFAEGEEGRHTATHVVCNCCGCCSESIDMLIGPRIVLTRPSCHNFGVTDNDSYLNEKKAVLTVTTWSGNVVYTETQTNFFGGTVDFSVSSDGFYKACFEIYGGVNQDQLEVSECFVVIELCTVLDCYKQLVQDVLCRKLPECDKTEFFQLAHQLNVYMATAGAFMSALAVANNQTAGLFNISEVELGVLSEAQFYFEKLLQYCSKCNNPNLNNLKEPCGCP